MPRVIGATKWITLCPCRHTFHHHGLDLRQIGKRLNALGAKMVRRDIKHCTDLAMTKRQSFAQNAASRRLQNRHADCRIAQNHRRAPGAARPSSLEQMSTEYDAEDGKSYGEGKGGAGRVT